MISRVEKREYRILTVYILIRTLNSSGELVPDPECKNPPEAPDSNCTNSELERDSAECMNSSSLEDPPRESDDTVGVAVGAAVAIVIIVNPRRACAARVTVVGLCVCLSVCLSVCRRLFSHYRLRGGL